MNAMKFAGEWTGTDRSFPPASPQPTEAPSRINIRSVVHDSGLLFELTHGTQYEAVGLLRHDDARDEHVLHWFDGGSYLEFRGSLENDELTLTAPSEQGSVRYRLRLRDDRLEHTLEMSSDGGATWMLFIAGELTRRA